MVKRKEIRSKYQNGVIFENGVKNGGRLAYLYLYINGKALRVARKKIVLFTWVGMPESFWLSSCYFK